MFSVNKLFASSFQVHLFYLEERDSMLRVRRYYLPTCHRTGKNNTQASHLNVICGLAQKAKVCFSQLL